MTDECRYILDYLRCEYELFTNLETDETLVAHFNEWTKEGKNNGFYPLIITVSDVLTDALECALEDMDNCTPAELRDHILKKAKNIDTNAFIENNFNEYSEMHVNDDLYGDFKITAPSHCFYSYMKRNVPATEIILAKIPAEAPWELPAWIPMGGFNSCPTPEEQVAIFKRWYQKYGAIPAAVTYENWEMEVQKPVLSNETALELAKEQFAFCYDIVMQSSKEFDSLKGLASILLNSTTWFFWWD